MRFSRPVQNRLCADWSTRYVISMRLACNDSVSTWQFLTAPSNFGAQPPARLTSQQKHRLKARQILTCNAGIGDSIALGAQTSLRS